MNKTLEKILDYTWAWNFIWVWIYEAKKKWNFKLAKLINKWSKFMWTDNEFVKKYLTK